MKRRALVWLAATAPMLAGCGGSTPVKRTAAHRSTHRPVCIPAALDAVARGLAVPAATITTSVSTGNNTMPQCTYATRVHGAERVTVTANVDTSPSPYFVLERTIVEASQIFTPKRLSPAPIAVPGLGLEASWFPEEGWLKATDGTVLVTATLNWSGAKQAAQIALARAVIAPYLHTPHGKAAEAKAIGYPSSG